MEGWRQGRPGSNVRIHRKKKEKTRLTHTGLLMEGVENFPWNLEDNFRVADDPGADR
jgi:hypothetical protein